MGLLHFSHSFKFKFKCLLNNAMKQKNLHDEYTGNTEQTCFLYITL